MLLFRAKRCSIINFKTTRFSSNDDFLFFFESMLHADLEDTHPAGRRSEQRVNRTRVPTANFNNASFGFVLVITPHACMH